MLREMVWRPGASRGLGPVTLLLSARVTAKEAFQSLPTNRVAPTLTCCLITAGARMLNRTSLEGMGSLAEL